MKMKVIYFPVFLSTTLLAVAASLSSNDEHVNPNVAQGYNESTAAYCHESLSSSSESGRPKEQESSTSTTTTMSSMIIHKIPIGNPPFRTTVLVVENFLNDALVQSTVDWLRKDEADWTPVIPHHRQEHENEMRPRRRLFAASASGGGGGYPGLRSNLTQTYQDALQKRLETLHSDLEQHVMHMPSSPTRNRTLHLQWSPVDSFFGNLCYDPASLTMSQRMPHIDQGMVQKRPIQVAIVHYLAPAADDHDATGTAFFRQVESAANRFHRSDCQELERRAQQNFKKGSTAYIQAASCHCRPQGMPCEEYQWYRRKVQKQSRHRHMPEKTRRPCTNYCIPFHINTIRPSCTMRSSCIRRL